MEFLFRLFHRPCFPRGELVAPWCRRSWNLRRPTGRSEMRRLGEALSRRPHHTTFSLVERSTYGAWRLHLGEDILKPENERENGFYVWVTEGGDGHPPALGRGGAREGAGAVAKAVSTAARIATPPEKFRGATQKIRGSAGKFGASKFPSGASAFSNHRDTEAQRNFRFTTGGGDFPDCIDIFSTFAMSKGSNDTSLCLT